MASGEAPDTEALWARYKAIASSSIPSWRDQALADRNDLVVAYASLAAAAARQVKTPLSRTGDHVDRDDLTSLAFFGLVDAIERFDPERGSKFETYAMARIRGNLLDQMRSAQWVPRTVKDRAREWGRSRGELQARLGRQATPGEHAAALGITVERYEAMRPEVATMAVDSIEDGRRFDWLNAHMDRPQEPGSTRELLAANTDDIEDGFDVEELRLVLSDAIDSLDAQARAVLALYYRDRLTYAEVGQALGVGLTRACQLHTAAILLLRERISGLDLETRLAGVL